MSWSTLTVEVTTPLFNAGGDGDADVRTPSLLGAMRFWFRALAGAHLGPDLEALRACEARVFGRAASDTGNDTPPSSPIQWRISRQPQVSPPGRKPTWLPSHGTHSSRDHGDDRWIVYLLGQGLGNLRDMTLNRPYIDAGQTFELRFRLRRAASDQATESTLALALAALRLTCTYGGVGARVRRGFGGLRIRDVTLAPGTELPPPWTDPVNLCTDTGSAFTEIEQTTRLWPALLGRCLPHLQTIDPRPGRPLLHQWTTPPPYPVLSRTHTRAALSSRPFSSWERVLEDTGEQWRRFRASEATPGVPYHPKLKTPEWTRSVTSQSMREFPLGALGLPVVYKDGWSVDAWAAENDGTTNGIPARRASPIWLRPVRQGDDWKLLTFAFLSDVLPPNGVTTRVTNRRRHDHDVEVNQRHLEDLAQQWVTAVADDITIEDGYRHGPRT